MVLFLFLQNACVAVKCHTFGTTLTNIILQGIQKQQRTTYLTRTSSSTAYEKKVLSKNTISSEKLCSTSHIKRSDIVYYIETHICSCFRFVTATVGNAVVSQNLLQTKYNRPTPLLSIIQKAKLYYEEMEYTKWIYFVHSGHIFSIHLKIRELSIEQ